MWAYETKKFWVNKADNRKYLFLLANKKRWLNVTCEMIIDLSYLNA